MTRNHCTDNACLCLSSDFNFMFKQQQSQWLKFKASARSFSECTECAAHAPLVAVTQAPPGTKCTLKGSAVNKYCPANFKRDKHVKHSVAWNSAQEHTHKRCYSYSLETFSLGNLWQHLGLCLCCCRTSNQRVHLSTKLQDNLEQFVASKQLWRTICYHWFHLYIIIYPPLLFDDFLCDSVS